MCRAKDAFLPDVSAFSETVRGPRTSQAVTESQTGTKQETDRQAGRQAGSTLNGAI
jgi:hypothetical protein